MEAKYYRIIVKLSVMVVLSVFMAATSFAQIYPSGMISYWKFDEASGNTAVDSMGINDGTLVNSPTREPGMVGGALRLSGPFETKDYVSVPHHSSMDIVGPFTFEAWIKLDINYGMSIFDKPLFPVTPPAPVNDSPNYRWFIGSGNQYGRTMLGLWSRNGLAVGDTDLGTGSWRHIATTFDGIYARFYVDGQLDATGTFGLGSTTTGPLLIGRDSWENPGRYVDGVIDEVAIYNRALTLEEIQKHYQNGLNCKGYEEVMALTCIGFEPPMDKTIEVKKKNRVLPLKMVLVDQCGNQMTNNEIVAPVVVVDFSPSTPGDTFLDELLYAGQGDEGNQFVFTTEGKWQFNLQTKNFTALGTYTIKAVPGDPAYVIVDPTCSCDFVIK